MLTLIGIILGILLVLVGIIIVLVGFGPLALVCGLIFQVLFNPIVAIVIIVLFILSKILKGRK